MARILYGVMGDARGHVSRSLAVAQAMPHHEFLFVGGGSVHDLKALGYQTEDLPMASTFYRDNRVDFPATIVNATKVLVRRSSTVKRLAEIIRRFDPDLILTDYELFTPLAAHKTGRPCISLDHQHILTHCNYDTPSRERLNRFLTCFSIRRLYSEADRFVIISFFDLPPSNPVTTEVLPPVLRLAVKEHAPSEGDHVLVYVTGKTFERLLSFLERVSRKFIVYGFGERPERGNLVFKAPSTHGFLEDLASCKYVISTAGHSTISDSLYFGKPGLCFPINGAYEQFLNAHFLAKLGFGHYISGCTIDMPTLAAFEARLDEYGSHIRKHDFFGNDRVAARLEELIGERKTQGERE
jgi:uncharacterized protein (TIGR00661 family)